MSEPLPRVGEWLLYRVSGTDEAPELRPAVVVRAWPGAAHCNVQVALDGQNDVRCCWPTPSDQGPASSMFSVDELVRGVAWRTSVEPGLAVGQWRRA